MQTIAAANGYQQLLFTAVQSLVGSLRIACFEASSIGPKLEV